MHAARATTARIVAIAKNAIITRRGVGYRPTIARTVALIIRADIAIVGASDAGRNVARTDSLIAEVVAFTGAWIARVLATASATRIGTIAENIVLARRVVRSFAAGPIAARIVDTWVSSVTICVGLATDRNFDV